MVRTRHDLPPDVLSYSSFLGSAQSGDTKIRKKLARLSAGQETTIRKNPRLRRTPFRLRELCGQPECVAPAVVAMALES